ncbi:unnamed protein product [Penicillium discolor]
MSEVKTCRDSVRRTGYWVGDSRYLPGSLLTTESRVTRRMAALSAAPSTKPFSTSTLFSCASHQSTSAASPSSMDTRPKPQA